MTPHQATSIVAGRRKAKPAGSFRAHLAHARESRQISPGAPIGLLADTLLVLCIGQQVEHVLRTEVAEPDRQWQIIRTVVAPWTTPTGRAVLPGPDEDGGAFGAA